MRRATWLASGLLGASTLVFGACGSDDDDSGGSGTTASGGSSSGTGGTSTSTNGSPSTTMGTSTTGAGGNGMGGNGGTGGGEAGGAGMGGEGGASPQRTSCEDLPSRAFDDDGFVVSSDDFSWCAAMPDANTCEGKLFPTSVSPELNWTEGPAGTMSYAVTFTDISILDERDPSLNGPYNQGYHWVIWDIPADVLGIPAELGDGHLPEDIEGARQWAPFQNYAFMGPCPNAPPPEEGDPPPRITDAYSFTVYAMGEETLAVPEPHGEPDANGADWSFPRNMDEYLRANALAAAEYRGTSDAVPSTFIDEEGNSVVPPMGLHLPCPSTGDQPEDCLEGP